MHLKLITHDRVVFDEDVDEIYTKGVDGEFGILKGHIPMMSALDVGVTKVVQGNRTRLFTTMGGIFQFKEDNAIILTDLAEDGSDIDVARAKAAKERAEAMLGSAETRKDIKAANAALARAMVRLKAAAKNR